MAILKWLDENFEEFLLMGLLILMTCVMGIQVVMRYVLNASLTWSEELTRYAFVWSSFLSISYCIKRQISIKINQFTSFFPESILRIIRFSIKVVMLLFFIYLFRHSIDVVSAAYKSGQRSPALGLPMYLVQVSTTVGFFLSIIRVIQSLLGVLNPTPPAELTE